MKRAILIAVVAVSCMCAQVNAFDIIQITDNGTSDSNPAISGGHVVWRGSHGAESGIARYNGASIQIMPNSQNGWSPATSGGRVAWVRTLTNGLPGLFWSDGASTSHLGVQGDNPGLYGSGSIGGGLSLVWEKQVSGANDNGIYFNTTAPIPGTADGTHPEVYARQLVWQGNAGVYYQNGHQYDGATFSLLPGSAGGRTPDIWGTRVVWESSSGIWLHDLSSGGNLQIATGGSSPAISGSYVVWAQSGIQAYDIAQDSTFQVSPVGTSPDISGSNVCWAASDGGDSEIYMTTIPEPATLSLLAIGSMALIRRRFVKS